MVELAKGRALPGTGEGCSAAGAVFSLLGSFLVQRTMVGIVPKTQGLLKPWLVYP